MEEWKEYKIGDICNIKHGFAFKGIHFVDEWQKYIAVTPGNFCIGGGFKLDKLKFYNGPIPDDFILKENDLIVTMTDLSKAGDTLGYSALIPASKDYVFLHNQRIGLVENISSEIDKHFLYWIMRTFNYQRFIVGHSSGSTVKHTSPTNIGKYIFKCPSIETQRKIVKILDNIDEKIEVNRRINEQLEELAGALFKSWFVDFEPFKDGEFVDSELGMIPKGWKVFELQELVHIKRGGSPRPIQNFLAETGYNWLKISDATSTSSPFIYEIKECIKEEGLSKTVFLKAGNLVLSNSATPGIPKFLGIDSCIHDGWLYFPKSSLSNEFLYLLFKYKRNYLISQGNGSVFTNLKTDIVKMLQLAIPDDSIISSFDIVIKSIFENIKKNQQEIHHLTTFRDTLLPKLMSGEIDVNEVGI